MCVVVVHWTNCNKFWVNLLGKAGVAVTFTPKLPLILQGTNDGSTWTTTLVPLAIGSANAATITETKRTNFVAISQSQCIALSKVETGLQ